MNKEKIISNLQLLSGYVKKDIECTNSTIEHWKGRIRTFGADTKIYGAGTYGQCLQESIETKEALIRRLNKNESLIQELEEDEKCLK